MSFAVTQLNQLHFQFSELVNPALMLLPQLSKQNL